MNDRNERPLPTNRARQGRGGQMALVILVVALVLLGLIWWGVHIYGTAIAPSEVAPDQEIGGPAN